MKTNLTFSTKKIWMTLLLMLTLAGWSNAAITVTMATANCSVSGNTIKFDVTATNNSGSTATIDFNSTVIRFTISSALTSGTSQGDIVFAYDTIDVSTSAVPNLWPPYSYPTFSFTNTARLAGVSTGTGIYTTSNCVPITAGSTITIGTFFITETQQNWPANTSVGLTWSTTSSINAYTNCSGSAIGYSSPSNRTLTAACSLTTPAACTPPSSATASSDFPTYCAGSTINFSSSVDGGDAPFTYVWSGPNGYASQEDSLISTATVDASGTYTVTVSNACGSATATTTLTVNANVTPSVSIASNLGSTICSGDVIFTATPTNGGTSPSYQWNVNTVNVGTNSSTYDYTPASGDVVICTLTADPTACPSPASATSSSITMTVVGSLTPSVSIASNATSNTTCAGTNVTFTATPTNGGSSPSYQWFVNGNVDNSSTTATYSNNTLNDQDQVTCQLSSSDPCASGAPVTSNTVTITVHSGTTPTISGTLSICSGNPTILDAGAGYSSYAWSDQETTETISVTAAGSFYVTVTNSFGCSGTSSTVNIVADAPINVQYASGNVTGCNGNANGSVSSEVTGGTSPYTYAWSNGATTASLSNVPAGNYTVTVTDHNGCTATMKKVIDYWNFDNTLPSTGAGAIALNNLTPDYSSTGGAQITFNQITTPLRDSILDNGSGGAAQNIRSGYAASGSANLYVRTRNPNSEDTLKFYMPTTGYQNIVLSFANEQSSAGKEVLQYAYSTDGGSTWDTTGLGAALGSDYYTPPTAFGLETINLSSISGANNNANFVFAILDTVTIATSGNNRYDNVTLEGDSIISGNPSVGAIVTQPAALSTTITPSGATTFCSGGSVTLTAPTASGNSYVWHPNNETTQSITVSASGSYSVTVTNGACSNTSTATVVTVNTLPTVVANASNTSICAGASETLTGSGAVSYAWTGGVTDGVSFTPSSTATYTVTGTDGNSCSNTASVTVTVNPILTPSVTIASNTGPGNSISVCSGQSVTFTPTPTNGGASPSYQWYLNGSSVSTAATYTYTPTTGDQVYCILTSNASCLSTSTATSNTVTITVTGSVTASLSIASGSGTTVCNGTSVTFTATPTNGGATPVYQWNDNGSNVGTNSATYTTTSLNNGDAITCVMTTSNSCASPANSTSNTLNMTVNAIPSSPTPASNNGPVCVGKSLTLSATTVSGATYSWTGPSYTSSTQNPTVSSSATTGMSGTYSVTATVSGCTSVPATTTVTVNANPTTPTITGVKTVCSGVATTLDAGAGYTTYAWSNSATTETISVSGAGTFSVTVTNASGCSATSSSVSVIAATAPFVTDSSANVSCNTGTNGSAVAVVNSGTSPFTYAWTGPNGYTATTASITGLAVGSYSVTVTDHNGCTATNKRLIYYWTFDNTLPLGGGGGTTLNNLAPDYTDASGGSAKITFNQIITPSRDSILDNGSGGSVENLRSGYASSVNGNNYVRTRNPNNEDTLKFYLPTTGFQNIVLSYAEEASSAGKDVNVFSYSTNGGSTWATTGLTATTYTAGLTFVTYSIDLRGISAVNNNANFIFAVNNSVNTTSGNTRYDNVTLEGDATNGSAGSPVIISQPIAASATITPSGATTFCQGGSVTLSAPAGMTTYKWSNNATTQSITVSASGSYTVKDSVAGCATTATSSATVVTVNPLPTVVANASNTSICSGTSETLTGSGAVSYAWTGGVTDGVAFTPASTATYTVTGTDGNSCTNTASATVTVTPTVTPSVVVSSTAGSGNSISICAGNSVTFTATPTNGGASPSYQWTVNGGNVGTNSATYTYNPANSDQVICTLTSNATCASPTTAASSTITVTVSGSVTPVVSIASGSGTTVCVGASVTFTATPTNGGGTPSYAWADNGSPVGTNSATYTTSSLANGDVITCVMTSSNSCASPSTATSNSLTMTVNALVSASVTIAGVPSGAICAGTSVTFTATPTNGGTPTYQWTVNGGNVGTNSATYTYAPANSDAVVCNMTSSLACTSVATSNTVTETVNPKPAPSISGTLALTCSGNSTTLDAGAGYSSYAWNNNETTETVSVSAGSYTVTVSNSSGCTASASASVTSTYTSPLVTDSSSNGCNGANNGFAAAVVSGGTSPYTYAWSNSATTAKITGLSAGSYSVTVTDHNGCTASLKKLIDYWSFDNTTPLGGNGGLALNNLTPDYSSGNAAKITFNQVLTPSRDSILDNGNGGANGNLRTGYNSSDYGNNYVRTRNPDNEDTLKFYIPTTGYQNIVLTFAEEQSSASKDVNVLSYSTNGGSTWSNSGIVVNGSVATTYTPSATAFVPVTIDLRSIPAVNNNPNFIFAINNSVNTSSGNARFDNVALEGDSIVAGQAGSSVVIVNPNAINTTVSGSTKYCPSGYTVLSAPNAGLTYAWSGGQSAKLTQQGDTIKTAGTYSVTITNSSACTATSTGISVTLDPTSSSASATACNSYLWNGTTYTTSGTKTFDAGNNAAGCDSIASLILTINHTNTSSTSQTACNSYAWNGTTYNTGGTYTYDAGNNAAGCDSVATLILTINSTSASSNSATACNSYAWNGTTYTTGGTYTFDAGNNAAGCDSVATLILTINSTSTSSTSATGCNSYSWNGTNYMTGGTYTYDAGNNAAGCDSVATLVLTINSTSTSSTSQTACTSYAWNGTTYTTGGTYTYDAGNNAAGCDSVATLILTINGTSTSSTSHTACTSYAWNGTTYTTGGTYTYDAGNNGAGCDSVATLILTINHSSTSSTSATACNSYSWNGTTYTTSGTKTFDAGNNAAGCDSVATLVLTINSSPTVSNIAGDSICIGATANLTPATGGTWASNSSGVASVTNGGVVTGLTAGTSTFTFTSTATGCSATTAALAVKVCSGCIPPGAPTGTSPQVFCSSSHATVASLVATGSLIKWYAAATGGTALLSTTALVSGHTYYASQTVNCESTTRLAVSVTINASPTVAAITGATAVCASSSGTLTTITLADVTAGGVWSTTSGTGSASVDGTGDVAGLTAGTVTVNYAVTNGSGCTTTVVKAIVVNPVPVVSVTSSVSPICNKTLTDVVLSSTVAGTSYNYLASGDPITSGYKGATGSKVATIAQTLLNTGTIQGVVTYTITPVAAGCTGSSITTSVTVNPVATGTATPSPVAICTGASTGITLNAGPVSGTTFTYTSVSAATVTGATPSCTSNCGTINDNLSNSGVVNALVTYTITPSANGCAGIAFKDVVTVRPVPTASTVDESTTICNKQKTAIVITGTTPGTIYNHVATADPEITGYSNGAGASIVQTLYNAGTTQFVATYVITPSYDGCLGSPITATVTVNPVATGTATPSPVAICTGSSAGLTLNAGPVSGTSFEYTSVSSSLATNTVTGATPSCTSGCGTSISDVLSNGGVANGAVTYSITPWANGCAGTVFKDVVTVRPVPVAYTTAASPYIVCNGTKTNIPLKSYTSGTIFLDTASITTTPNGGTVNGLANGTLATIAQTLTNTGTSQGVVTYNCTPSYYGCLGSTIAITATVNPVATGSASPSPAGICSGFPAGVTLNAGAVSGTNFTWVATASSSISGATSCTDTTGACGTSINTVLTTTAIGAIQVYTVTPYANGCAGTKFIEDVTVQSGNPVKPTITGTSTKICAGNGATYTYTVSNLATFNSVMWTLPATGCTIVTGSLTTNPITITYPTGYVSGTISATAVNLCGNASIVGTLATNTRGSACRESDNAPVVASTMNMVAYPNPAHDMLNVQFNRDQAGSYTLQLMDLTGRMMLNQANVAQQGNNLVEIDLSNYAKGVYMISLTTDDGNRQVVRIVVE